MNPGWTQSKCGSGVRWHLVLAIGASLLLAAAVRADLTVALRPAARLGETRPVLLTDIAVLGGSDAETAGGVVVLADPAAAMRPGVSWVEIGVDHIRDALKSGSFTGALSISGTSCAVRFTRVDPATAASPDLETAAGPVRRGDAPSAPVPGTVAELVTRRLAAHLGVVPDDLRVNFREGRDAATILGEPTEITLRRVDVAPTASPGSARQTVRITIYDGERVHSTASITADVEVRTEVVVATSFIERGREIAAAHVAAEERWATPSARPPAAPNSVIGAVARTDIKAGEVLLESHVQAAIAAKRGDVVYVDYLAGSFTLKARARALGTARDGEEVDLRLEGSDRAFRARMTGRGRAVLAAP